ncbi:MAG: hypothetical protein A3F53_02490 [Candidatus Zambryskibacteria bacterium RIFCSPHIGHO2_12_FULL_48_10]|uniref:HNH nuclease domain-containing protein n=1 Tax=Candidatus Zambryskibacteria bacterium RIFCSPHIGHO2_01_FULL_46_25 TaxID=1802738 RepID=A0A1G2SY31_9BACT|nr:MAG: hypothetical protein A2838_01235 [Candidatus Zambryskibacteria bacterium RIFCSPHIGHO2_01_FULL_46_25]OHB02741.1 MAG: hypothetical protein A3F53_02490 [Candidatus Zambryskibacteria bacterium RIFCSPHIGHO2_12_FULL_48_10]OHB06736.1 MAG: hypothetical protein A3A31_00295 [Candidatus Zambryskibacteria bacterium RIFCSPLOWO2_01_FULL_48_25]
MEHPLIGVIVYFSMFAGFCFFINHLDKEDKEKKRIHRQQMKDSHRDYLSSEKWRQRKVIYFNKFRRLCIVCNSSFDIDLHHKNYQRLYAELDQDLVPLCRTHHDAFHRTGRRVKDTDIWIIEEQKNAMIKWKAQQVGKP